MTEELPVDEAEFDTALASVLGGLSQQIRQERSDSVTFKAMDTARSIGGVVRALELATTTAVLDAHQVLTERFGFQDTRKLYDYLYQIPHRYKLYRAAFMADTHVACVDRTVSRIVAELKAGGQTETNSAHTDPRFATAALAPSPGGGAVGADAAAEVLVTADLFDDSRRIQRLSCDAHKIAKRISAGHPGISAETLHATVRLVLMTAAEIVHEQDGVA